MVNGLKEYTKGGNLKRVPYEEICRWISEAWKAVPVSAIKNGFRKTTINFYNEETEELNEKTEEIAEEDVVSIFD